MPKLAVFGLCAVATCIALTAVPLRPGPALAAAATLSVEAALHEAPEADAAVLAVLAAGTVVSIDGPPVAGFYPVTTGDLSGWTWGEALLVEERVAGDDLAGSGDAVAEEPAPGGEETGRSFPDAGPLGPAIATEKTPILLGPGPDHGLIAMAPAGSSVEQTGHLIDGYVTVQYAEVTGWAPLDHLGPPGSPIAATPVRDGKKRGDRK